MMNQLADRIGAAALSMSPRRQVDKLLAWLEELSGAMALPAIDELTRNEKRRKVLFD